MRRFQLVLGLISASAVLPAIAHAEGTQASPTAKGTIGGALLGAESVMLVEAAAGTKPAWAYAVGGGLGAAGGAVGGYFTEKGSSAKLPIYLLVGGMALAIPTTVAVLSTTAYEPTNYVEDRPPADEPVAEPAQSTGAPAAAPATPASEPPPAPSAPDGASPATGPSGKRTVPGGRVHRALAKSIDSHSAAPALVGMDGKGTLALSLPAVEVRQMYTRTEIAMYGVKQHTVVEVPVFNVVF
jgi:hypothetical protein